MNYEKYLIGKYLNMIKELCKKKNLMIIHEFSSAPSAIYIIILLYANTEKDLNTKLKMKQQKVIIPIK